METIHDLNDRQAYEHGVCVPTMGALHTGHRALIEYAVSLNAGPVIVTVFVNPSQFGPNEDFNQYPRTLDTDCAMCESAGADVVFAPSVDLVYPNGVEAGHVPPLSRVATEPGLDDACRPGHFAGVCQVVYRLFELVKPAVAIFGEKDYQQLLVIRAMVESEQMGIDIIGRPTVREPDGLAMSSRNVYLTPDERRRALGLSLALKQAAHAATPLVAERVMSEILTDHQVDMDYAVVRDAVTLEPIESYETDRPARALIAGRVGTTRLIDNGGVG